MRLLLSLCFTFISLCVSAQHYYLFIGTYTTGGSKGIYVYDFNAKTGETKPFPTDPAFGIPKQPLEFVVMKKII